MLVEPNYFRTDYDWEAKKWNGTNIPVGPVKVIDWMEALSTAQRNEPKLYTEITNGVIKYANFYGHYKRDKILESWGISPEQI